MSSGYQEFHRHYSLLYREENTIKNQNLNFSKDIESPDGKTSVVLFFFNKWHPFLENIIEFLQMLAENYKVKIIRVNCENRNTIHIQRIYGVLCCPTFIVIKNGSKIGYAIGSNFEKLENLIKKKF